MQTAVRSDDTTMYFSKYPDKHCYEPKGATNAAINGANHGPDCRNDVASSAACQFLCLQSPGCEAVVHYHAFCCARKDVDLDLCEYDEGYT